MHALNKNAYEQVSKFGETAAGMQLVASTVRSRPTPRNFSYFGSRKQTAIYGKARLSVATEICVFFSEKYYVLSV